MYVDFKYRIFMQSKGMFSPMLPTSMHPDTVKSPHTAFRKWKKNTAIIAQWFSGHGEENYMTLT